MEADLVVHRHQIRYRVPDTGAAWRAQRALHSVVEQDLPDVLAAMLPDESDTTGLWLIRRMSADVSVSSHWPTGRIAARMASEIRNEVQSLVDRGADGVDVLWFPNRAAYLARFLSDLAQDVAHARWFYKEFEHIMALPASSAIREALCAEPGTAIEALCELLPGESKMVLRQLTPHDSEDILKSLSPGGEIGGHSFLSLLEEVPMLDSISSEARQMALALFIECIRKGTLSDVVGVGLCARQIVEVHLVLRRLPQLAEALRHSEVVPIRAALGEDGVARIIQFLSWPESRRKDTVERILAPPTTSSSTRFGGVFLLLPLLQEFPWEEMTRDWPEAGGVRPAQLLPLLTVAGALGRQRMQAALKDVVLKEAIGIPPELKEGTIAEWTRAITKSHVKTCRGTLLARLVATNRMTIDDKPGREGDVSIDKLRGIWTEVHRSRNGEGELGYVLPHPQVIPNPHLRRLLAQLSQTLLRELAWRLPGFSKSTLSYLFENFLDFSAQLETEDGRTIVSLGKPPLHIVLTRAGMNRREFRLPATGDQLWILTHLN